ncbi:MAG: hypothetical protein EHM71_02820 [Zetaproteobacteria bacterium]|nr:MAG: hypothetical protein EHM71_02820 [Zetaproteobacteria bacterium]
MKTIHFSPMLAGVIVATLSACASTTLDTTWRDPTFAGQPFTKVLVVGSTDSAENRRIFEDTVVGELKARGVNAVASYTMIPNESDVKRERVIEAVRTAGADCVISTRVVGVETKREQVPVQSPFPGDMDLYRQYSPMEAGTTIRQDYQIAHMESNLFDARTGKMVWWGRSSAFPTADISRLSRELGNSIISSLKDAKLL